MAQAGWLPELSGTLSTLPCFWRCSPHDSSTSNPTLPTADHAQGSGTAALPDRTSLGRRAGALREPAPASGAASSPQAPPAPPACGAGRAGAGTAAGRGRAGTERLGSPRLPCSLCTLPDPRRLRQGMRPGVGRVLGPAGAWAGPVGAPATARDAQWYSGAGSACRTRAPGVLQPPPAPPRFVRSRSRCHPQPRGHRWPGDAAAARCRGPRESPGVCRASGASPLVAVGAAGAGRPLPGQDSCSLAARCPWSVPAGNHRRDFRCGE